MIGETIPEITIGSKCTLGKPVLGEYKHLYTQLRDLKKGNQHVLPLIDLEGRILVVQGIIRFKQGQKYIRLAAADKQPIYGNLNTLFADFNKSVKEKELLLM